MTMNPVPANKGGPDHSVETCDASGMATFRTLARGLSEEP
jgi:hypothetical protein